MDAVTGTGVIAFAIFVLIYSVGFPPAKGADFGPALFPRILAGILLVLGILVVFRAMRERSGVQDCDDQGETLTLTPAGWRNLIITVIAVVTYIAVVSRTGFILTTVVFLFVLMKTYGLSALKGIIAACLITGSVYVLFSILLRVVLP